jgi:DtxR family Mn-dependent transcriptional regulator
MFSDDLVDTTEMYLKAVLELQEEGIAPMRARLVERFDHGAPTVSSTVRRLERDGLVELDAEHRLSLTPTGGAIATDIMRKHRLAEVFLNRVLGLEWTLLHEEACRWEHVMSDRVAELIDALLSQPGVTPYGNPLHGAPTGISTDWVSLTRECAGPVALQLDWIGEVAQADPGALALLWRHQLLPGEAVDAAFNGKQLVVRPADSPDAAELPLGLAKHLFGRVLRRTTTA